MERVKYPSTPYFEWSPGRDLGDGTLADPAPGTEVVVSTKQDGESFSGYSDGFSHARSPDPSYHPSRTYARRMWQERFYLLPHPSLLLSAENMYAEHSIFYDDLEGYLLVIGFWDTDRDVLLDWGAVEELARIVDLPTVPVLYRGPYNRTLAERLFNQVVEGGGEGIVMRLAGEIPRADFSSSVWKAVRQGHVQTDQHWLEKPVVPNKLAHK